MRNLIIMLSMLLAGVSFGQDGAAMLLVMGQAEQVAFPSDGLVAYYGLDGDAYDEVSETSGTWGSSSTETNLAINGTALSIPDANGYVIAATPSLLNGATDYTVSAWVRQVAHRDYAGVVLAYTATRNTGIMEANTLTGNAFADSGWAAGIQESGTFINGTITVGEWVHLVGVGKNIGSDRITELWADGSLVKATTNAGNSTLTQTGSFRIGSNQSRVERWFDGIIDEVGIWNRALTEQEISDIYTYQLVYP